MFFVTNMLIRGKIMAEEKIKACPFCGGTAYLNSNYSNRTRSFFVMCKCDVCGSQGKTYQCNSSPVDDNWDNASCDSAIRAWNMRASSKV